MLKTNSGKKPTAVKACIYGPEGIGKTTLASQFPDPVILDLELGSSHMDVRRVDNIKTWADLLATMVLITPEDCRTVVIDTADKAEEMCRDYVLERDSKKSIEDYGYGKGYTVLSEEYGKLMGSASLLIRKGINVVFVCHAQMRKFEQPDEMGSYDRWELKLQKKVAPLLKEWADLLLFLNYKTIIVNDSNGKGKAQGGKRVMYTSHHPCWDAKNRFGLPEEMDLDYGAIKSAVEQKVTLKDDGVQAVKNAVEELKETKPKKTKTKKAETVSRADGAGDDVPEKLLELMRKDDIAEDEIRHVIGAREKYNPAAPWDEIAQAGVLDWIYKFWDKVVEMIREDPDRLPF